MNPPVLCFIAEELGYRPDLHHMLDFALSSYHRHGWVGPQPVVFSSTRSETLSAVVAKHGARFDELPDHGRRGTFLDALVKKIQALRYFPEDQEMVVMDCDTEVSAPYDGCFEQGVPVLCNGEYHILSMRNLGAVLPQCQLPGEVQIVETCEMMNSGVVYIPKERRRELADYALAIVDELGRFPADQRFGDKLDEQIALSIVVQWAYPKVDQAAFHGLDHHWPKVHSNIRYWE